MSSQQLKASVIDYIAPIWKRYLAAFFDWMLLNLVIDAIFRFLYFNTQVFQSNNIFKYFDLMMFAGLFLGYFIYKYLFELLFNATLGKLIFGLGVVDKDGKKLNGIAVLKRYMFEFIYVVVTLLAVVYFTWGELFLSSDDSNMFSIEYMMQEHANRKRKMIIEMTLLSMPFIWILANLILLAFNRNRRSLRDHIAGTLVINERKRRKQQRL